MSKIEQLYISLNKDKIFKFKATSQDGRSALGRTRQDAIDKWHLRFDEEKTYGFDINILEKSIDINSVK